MQLNVIRLLAKMTVAVNKSEIVDMILPLFIESLEEGDASTPGLLRLQVWELLSCNIICDVDVSHYIVTSLFFLPSVDGFLLLSYFFFYFSFLMLYPAWQAWVLRSLIGRQ